MFRDKYVKEQSPEEITSLHHCRDAHTEKQLTRTLKSFRDVLVIFDETWSVVVINSLLL